MGFFFAVICAFGDGDDGCYYYSNNGDNIRLAARL